MADRYSLVNYDSDEELAKHPNGPPMENLMSACIHIVELLRSANLNFAVMGGFGLRLRGSPRPTRDIDVAVEARMAQLWPLVEPQTRLTIPNTKMIEGVMKIFVKTGPEYDHCVKSMRIEVDLIICGSNGSPRTLVGHRRMLQVTSRVGQQVQIPVLDILHALRSKMRACSSRGAPRDISDTMWIIESFQAEVESIKGSLNPGECDEFLEKIGGPEKPIVARILGR